MKKLLEQLIETQNNLDELNWRKAAGGALLAASLLGVPSIAQAATPVKITQEEKQNIVAKVIAGEAAGEGYMGMKAVACVIQNRKKDPIKVVTKPYQFSAYNDKALMNRNYAKVKKEADELASQIGKLDDITGGATHYVAKWLYDKKKDDPKSWISKMKVTKIIGNHVFMVEAPK